MAPLILASESGVIAEIKPTRGLDVGSVTFHGHEVSWRGAMEPSTDPWLAQFSGGLVVTCGLHNVGLPADGHGLHGRFALLEAQDVKHGSMPDGGSWVTGLIEDAGLLCHRRVTLSGERAILSITDDVANTSGVPLQAPLLYHVNIGGAIRFAAALVDGPVVTSTPRETKSDGWPDWRRPGLRKIAKVATPSDEYVWEHHMTQPWIRVWDPERNLGIRAAWFGLNRVHQWVAPHLSGGALAIEPANCSVLGREHDRSHGVAPILNPGATRRTVLSIEMISTDLERI